MLRALTIPMPQSLLFVLYHFSDFPFGWQLSFFLVADYNHLSNISYILHNHLDLEKPVITWVFFGVRKREDSAIVANGLSV
ncbi:hypothetical protein COCC4DRAFT_63133 [Bipolaris maydis ATCC 48331]|uniref:Uncharacterized protein n=2 Tax=Cochliobolus heterostrophus TaxID=5016 RepID=M2TK32_COCH5|nr:uncharacterized protein COCC4DRAFT_63133 [Bipolaris maydis ATCC 48331]EMD97820.1 hypothetical protein COCHEDRAFT_1083721 [Bipolaris maydis C5]ENI02784.1 hypothetical protein COCC4DRAFT_63133 [Bipolaris maydis ATCC 48331]